MDITTGENNGQILFTGVYANPQDPIWSFNNITSPANLEVSTLTVNSVPAGNILLTHNVSSGTEYNAPLLFQRPPADPNAPVEALMMNNSVGVPTKSQDGEYITALKDNQTVYDDIAVAGLQIFGNQTIGASSIAYIDGIPGGDVRINIANGALAVSSLKVSTLFADTVVSTTSGTANSYTASIYMSTPILYTGLIEVTKDFFAPSISTTTISTNTISAVNISTDKLFPSSISTNYISTNDMYASTIRAGTSFVSSANISSLNAGNFGASRIDVTLLSSLTGDITFNLVSTLSLFGNVDVNLGLGNQIAGLIGGAASQGLGVVLGGSALATGSVALITGRTSGGVNSNVFQTVNGTTQLQFSTIGTATTSVFLDTNSAAPGTTPALQTSTTINVPAGAYCVRSVSDPLNINNNESTIQSFGQWVPVIQGNPTLPSFTTSTLTVSTLLTKSAEFSTLAVSSIGGNQQFSSIQMTGNLSSTNLDATFSWGAPGFETSIRNQTVRMPYVTLSTLNVLGDTQAQQVFGLSGNFNTLVGSNQVRGTFITGSNWVSTPQLTVSSINGAVYPPQPSSIGGNVILSTIQVSGNLSSTNANATFSWGAPGLGTTINNTTVVMPYVTASTLNVLGDTQARQVFGLSGNFNTLVASNAVTASFVTGSNWVSTPQLTVSSINGASYPPPNFLLPSTLTVSTLQAKSAEISSLSVSSIGATVRMSSILTTGSIFSQNPAATLVWGSPGFQTVLSQTSTVMGNARAGTLTVVGDTLANQVFGASGNFNTVTGSNQVNGTFITGSNWISTPQLSVSSINGAAYPPPNVPAPSTLFASSINMTGNLTGGGGYISWPTNSAAPWSSTIIGAGGIITNTLSTQTANISSLNLVGDINSGGTANLATINTSTLNASSMSSKGGVVSSMVVSSLNGQIYPPPNFGISLPSTVNISTLAVNGGLTLTNTNAFNNLAGITAPQYVQMFVQVSPTTTRSLTIGGPPGQVVPYAINCPSIVAGGGGGTSLFEGPLLLNNNISTINSAAVASFATLNARSFAVSTFTAGQITTTNQLGVNNLAGLTTPQQIQMFVQISPTTTQSLNIGGYPGQVVPFAINAPNIACANSGLNNVFEGPVLIRNLSTTVSGGVATFAQLNANTISTTNLSVSGSVTSPLTINGFTTMSNAQAYGITANSVTASNTIQADVLTGRVIQATQNLTTPLMTIQNLNVQQTAGISTGIVSSLFTNFINNQPYPPTTGVTGDTPSTMYASTVYIDGGLTVRGLGQNYITAANISSLSSVNVTGILNASTVSIGGGLTAPQGSITRANISSLSSVSVTGLLNASTVLFNGGMTNTGGLPIITSNLSAVNIDNVAFINGQIYPPPSGSTSIPSTLYASTVNVNGGLTINGTGALTMNGPSLNFIDTSFPRINGYITANSGTLQTALMDNTAYTITRGSSIASTLMFMANDGRVRFTSSMTVRDPVLLGTPSQAFIQTYSSGLEAPAGSVFTANVSTPSIETSSITLAGSGSRIVGDATGLGPGINFLTNDFQIYSASGTTAYFDMGQGVGATAGSTFFSFGGLNNPATAYLTAGNYWTYYPQVGAFPAGGVVTSTISTIAVATNTLSSRLITASTMATSSLTGVDAGFGNTSTNTLWAGNISTPNISVSSINKFSALPSVSGNIQMILDTTNGAGGFGSFQIQPQSTLYIKSALSIGSAGGLSDTLRQYAASSIGFAQVNPHIVLSADSIVSTANIQWGFAKDGSPPVTTALSYFINNLSTSKTNVKTNLGWLGLPNSELYNVLDTTLTPGYLTIKNTTSTIVYVEGVPQYASATTAPYGI